jgi:hypothetical protein
MLLDTATLKHRFARLRGSTVKDGRARSSGLSFLEDAVPGSEPPDPEAASRRLRRSGPTLPGAGEASKESKGGSRGSRVRGSRGLLHCSPHPLSSDRSFLRPTRLPLDRCGGSRPPKAPRSGLWAWRRRSQGDRDRRSDPKTLRQAEEKTHSATFFSLRSPGTHLREVRSYNAPRLVVAKRTNLLLFFRTPKAEEQATHPNSRRAPKITRLNSRTVD